VLNLMSRFHLAALALKRVPRFRQRADALIAELETEIQKAVAYSREHFEDPPAIANWVWTG
jgi:xylulose-5-phosphate/fructose-6-phosphate phosphoketolase